MDYYRDRILDHYHHPRHFGELEKPDVEASDENISCGDRITIHIVFGGESSEKTIADIRFSGEGCAINQASASLLSEHVIGKSIDQIQALKREDIEALLGTTLTPARVKCALLPLEVIQKALQKRNG